MTKRAKVAAQAINDSDSLRGRGVIGARPYGRRVVVSVRRGHYSPRLQHSLEVLVGEEIELQLEESNVDAASD